MSAEWTYRTMGTEVGPLSPSELVRHAGDGRIQPDTEVRKDNGQWIPASRVNGLFDQAAGRQPNVPPIAPPPPPRPPAGTRLSQSMEFEVLEHAENQGFKVEILQYQQLAGAKDPLTASRIYFGNQAGIRLKQVRIALRDGEAIAESGALHFMLGHIELESKIGGISGLGKAMMNKFVTKEAAILPRYRGHGQIYLEPSFTHYILYRLVDEEIIADKGMFYCGEGTLDVGSALQKNVSSALFGGEGFFQTRVRGSGICVFESPVPAHETLRVDLKDETLQVDGNFALMRTGRIDFSVEKSTRSLLGTLTSGEGLLQTFRGTGTVWLAPTKAIYDRLSSGDFADMTHSTRSSNNS